MQSDEIAEAVLKLKSEGKIIDFGLSNHQFSNRFNSSKTAVGYNQIQFSATTFEPMIDGSRLHANQQYSSYVLESTEVYLELIFLKRTD
jgi:predicted oxidoreductase